MAATSCALDDVQRIPNDRKETPHSTVNGSLWGVLCIT